MQAIAYNMNGDLSVLRVETIDKPSVADHEAESKSAYAAVNPVDFKTRAGYLKDLPHEETVIPGWNVAGTVVTAPLLSFRARAWPLICPTLIPRRLERRSTSALERILSMFPCRLGRLQRSPLQRRLTWRQECRWLD
jgi:hypothetical protein